jgi:hypothetical protein
VFKANSQHSEYGANSCRRMIFWQIRGGICLLPLLPKKRFLLLAVIRDGKNAALKAA